MDKPATAAPAPDQAISFSLRQVIAVMTAVGAGFAVFYPLLSPPAGSSGLSWAMLPAGVLAAALWFSRSNTSVVFASLSPSRPDRVAVRLLFGSLP
jgi:hypothetical protein